MEKSMGQKPTNIAREQTLDNDIDATDDLEIVWKSLWHLIIEVTMAASKTARQYLLIFTVYYWWSEKMSTKIEAKKSLPPSFPY